MSFPHLDTSLVPFFTAPKIQPFPFCIAAALPIFVLYVSHICCRQSHGLSHFKKLLQATCPWTTIFLVFFSSFNSYTNLSRNAPFKKCPKFAC